MSNVVEFLALGFMIRPQVELEWWIQAALPQFSLGQCYYNPKN